MWKALALKEFQELRLPALLALVAYLYVVFALMGAPLLPGDRLGRGEIPFMGSTFYMAFCVVAALFGIGMGLRQTLGEALGGTYQFLLTRPAGHACFCVKLIVGLALYLAVSAIPILIYAVWAAVPGTHASPFEWSMTVPAWLLWLGLSLIYFGAFLTGLRPARWLGTRLLPLAGAAVGAFLLAVDLDMIVLRLAGIAVGLVLLLAVWFVARTRDYA